VRQRRLISALVVVALGAQFGPGCGDDDGEPTSTTTGATDAAGSITIEQWAESADRICSEGDRAVQQTAAQRFGDDSPTEAEIEEFGDTVTVPNLQAQHDAIAELPKPNGEADEIDAMLGALQDGIDALADDPLLLVQGTDSVPGIAKATEIADDLGLTDCGA
jgi:hypothetical protein